MYLQTFLTFILTVLASLISFSFWYSVISRFLTLPSVALQPGPPWISRCEAEDPDELPDEAPLGIPRLNKVALETKNYKSVLRFKQKWISDLLQVFFVEFKHILPWLFGWCIWKWLLEVAYGQISCKGPSAVGIPLFTCFWKDFVS